MCSNAESAPGGIFLCGRGIDCVDLNVEFELSL